MWISTKATSRRRRLEIFLLTWGHTIKEIRGSWGTRSRRDCSVSIAQAIHLAHFRLFLPKIALKSKHILRWLFPIEL